MMAFEISSQTNVVFLLHTEDWSVTNTSPDVCIKRIESVALQVEIGWRMELRTDSAP